MVSSWYDSDKYPVVDKFTETACVVGDKNRRSRALMHGVCVKCGKACEVVVQDKRTVSACCEANAVEDGGLFIIDAAELPPAHE
jgi:hypothetical protein